MEYLIGGVIGLIVGAVAAWLVAAGRAGASAAMAGQLRDQLEKAEEVQRELRDSLDQAVRAKVKAETEAGETAKRFLEQRKTLEDARSQLADAFKALAGDALNKNTGAFLTLAKQTFEKIVVEARGDLGKRQEAINGLVKPLAESLGKFELHVRGLEKNRQEAYASLETHLKSLTATQTQLQKETAGLVTALRTPQVRGRWGEMTLRRVVELAGMSDHCDFTEQVSVNTEDGSRLRPDLIVQLPGDREIVVDAKVSLDAFLTAASAESEEDRKAALVHHARQMRTHMTQLAGKTYWKQFDKAPEFAVMFVPGESFFAAAADVDRSLIEDGLKRRVILATPTTLMALLRAVAFGWRQEQVARNAQEISDLGKQLYDRMRVLADHVRTIGGGLLKANTAYNKAVGSMERMVVPAARRFKDLGAGTGQEIAAIEPVEITTRELSLPELDNGDNGEAKDESASE